MQSLYISLANVILVFHVAYVSFVLIGLILVWLGWACGWQWIRNVWFRLAHLIAILVVAAETVVGMTCPLSTWEWTLREWGGQTENLEGDFIGNLFSSILYYDLPQGHWIFQSMYYGFAAVILLTYILIPPRIGGTRGDQNQATSDSSAQSESVLSPDA